MIVMYSCLLLDACVGPRVKSNLKPICRGIFFVAVPSSILGAKKKGGKKEESSCVAGLGNTMLINRCKMQITIVILVLYENVTLSH